ncbi:nucleoside triphosphate pyrophosphohydrolase [Devosia sp.]|uniref:nucleoside triphosphate pyrophosphohydrolase n=1 Tax=Devosia sp. TaxID=1871048 RepID=UPI003A900C23
MTPSRDLSRLLEIMAALRNPDGGCPWDIEQDFSTIKNYTIEEAYEVADAIEREDYDDLREELGDLLLQPVYHAQMARERGLFEIGDVIYAVTEKLIRRHPHVFGEEAARNAGGAKAKWEEVKADERARKAAKKGQAKASLLDDVPYALPALMRAEKLTKRAAKVGFDWPSWRETADKVQEEFAEVEAAVTENQPQAAVTEEIGDLLFATVNLARQLGVDPEAALRDANLKFSRRFQYVEARAAKDGVAMEDAGLERLDGYWNEIRAADKSGGDV